MSEDGDSAPRLTPSGEALTRLNALLPLAEREAALPPALRALHRAVLSALVTHGRAYDMEALRQASGLDDVAAALRLLQEGDLVVLDRDGQVCGSYPVTLEDTPHRVQINGLALHAMCSVDALAFSPMFGLSTVIESRCHQTGLGIRLEQQGTQVNRADPRPDIHVGIRWQPPGACAAHSLCREMHFFVSGEAAALWQSGEDGARSVLSLTSAIQLAADFFLPLLR